MTPAEQLATEALQLFREFRFEEAAQLAAEARRVSAVEAAPVLAKARPIFPNRATAERAECFFRAAGNEENLAQWLQSVGKLDEASTSRNNLSIRYREQGRPEEADALFPADLVCEHLRPVLEALRRSGAHVVYAGTPWSRNCRTWVYVDRVIDTAPFEHAPLEKHTHRGTHDGAEHGLVCTIDHDGVMGSHPGESFV